ncbi:hypothetical protein TELCIR_20881, partial [Teladorsagia circumcincta]
MTNEGVARRVSCTSEFVRVKEATDRVERHDVKRTRLTAAALIMVCLAMLSFTLCSSQYQRFYMPTSFLCTFLICLVTLLIFSSDSKSAFMTPVASLATSFQ